MDNGKATSKKSSRPGEMIKRLKPKSEFSRNVLTLMTGATIAQAIPIAITPILTRLYTPEDFGLLALFIAITAILGSIANARYELAIILPEKDEDAINIAALGLLIAICFSLVLFIPAIVLNGQITSLLGNEEISFWLYFVPFVVLMMGLYNVLNYLNNRKKLYKDIALSNVYKATAASSVQLAVGAGKFGATGLITGQIISQIVANYRLAKNTKVNFRLKDVDKKKIFVLADRYKDFPKFTLWATLANSLSQHLTSILISIVYGLTIIGHYSLVQRALGMPASLIGSSISKVFFQAATEEKKITGKSIKSFKKVVIKLFFIGLTAFGFLYFIIEDLFVFFFGEKWYDAGRYARVLLPFFFISFIASAVSPINIVFERQKMGLFINLLLLISSLAIVFLSYLNGLDFEVFLKVFTIVMSVEYFGFLMYYWFLSRGCLS